jgi:hypothetical protein
MLVAIGVLASSLTRNQIVSAILSFVAMLLMFYIGFLDVFIRDPQTSEMIQHLSLIDHIASFSKGFLDVG